MTQPGQKLLQLPRVLIIFVQEYGGAIAIGDGVVARFVNCSFTGNGVSPCNVVGATPVRYPTYTLLTLEPFQPCKVFGDTPVRPSNPFVMF